MPRRTVTVRVQWHDVGRGLWCERCALPSVVRWVLINVDTLGVMGRWEACEDCGHVERIRG